MVEPCVVIRTVAGPLGLRGEHTTDLSGIVKKSAHVASDSVRPA